VSDDGSFMEGFAQEKPPNPAPAAAATTDEPGGPDGPDAPDGPGSGRRHRAGNRSRDVDVVLLALRGAGQTLITAGLVILLFVVYEVWVSNIFAHAAQTAVHNTLIKEWQQGDDPLVQGTTSLPGSTQSTIATGTGIANIYIPRLGDDYHFTIVQGTDDSALGKGPGHYIGTALPGQVGDFAVAGHRVGKGEPFLNIDHLVPGDSIVIQTASYWYVYVVMGDVATGDLSTPGVEGVVGREIVSPSDGNVIAPVPDHPGQAPTVALLTLTTCHPKFTATKRMIIHASLQRTIPKDGTKLPKELSGGTL
jgi:sortase A